MTPEHQQLIQRIRTSAEAIQQAVATIPPARQTVAPKPGEWSVKQVLLHTRDVAMLAYGMRIRRLLIDPDFMITSYEEDEYRLLNPGDTESVDTIVQMLAAEHGLVANLLASMPDDAWERAARHPEGGTRSIAYFAQRFAAHAEEHAAQIAALNVPLRKD